MADSTAPSADRRDLREKIAHIDQRLADIDRSFAQWGRPRQEIRYAPWLAVMTRMGAGAALVAAGAALFAALQRLSRS
jgi:hypothetical protein